MGKQVKQKIICDFTDEVDLNHAVSELEEHGFTSDEMGLEKIVDEYVEINKKLIKRPWLTRDSLQDLRQQNGLMAGVIAFVGLGLLFASIIAINNLGGITFMQEQSLFILLLAVTIILLSAIIYQWMMRDTKQQLKEQRPSGIFRFWVKTSSAKNQKEVHSILMSHGASIVTT